MTSGELAAVGVIIGSVISALGITGIDSGLISQAVNGVIAIATIVGAVYAWYQHKNAAIAAGLR